MTEYHILVYESALRPATIRHMGIYEAESQEKAVEKFKEETSHRGLQEELDFAGTGSISTVAAVPNRYYGTFEIDRDEDTVEKT